MKDKCFIIAKNTMLNVPLSVIRRTSYKPRINITSENNWKIYVKFCWYEDRMSSVVTVAPHTKNSRMSFALSLCNQLKMVNAINNSHTWNVSIGVLSSSAHEQRRLQSEEWWGMYDTNHDDQKIENDLL